MSKVNICTPLFIRFVLKIEGVWRTGCAECGQSCHHFSVCEIHTFVFQLTKVSESSAQIFLYGLPCIWSHSYGTAAAYGRHCPVPVFVASSNFAATLCGLALEFSLFKILVTWSFPSPAVLRCYPTFRSNYDISKRRDPHIQWRSSVSQWGRSQPHQYNNLTTRKYDLLRRVCNFVTCFGLNKF
jgi:hypothetical protein